MLGQRGKARQQGSGWASRGWAGCDYQRQRICKGEGGANLSLFLLADFENRFPHPYNGLVITPQLPELLWGLELHVPPFPFLSLPKELPLSLWGAAKQSFCCIHA